MFIVVKEKRRRGRHLMDGRKKRKVPVSTPRKFDANSTVESVTIGRNIAKWRIKRNLSQRELGRMIPIQKGTRVMYLRQGTVARIEAGYKIRKQYVRLFARALKIPYKYLAFNIEQRIRKFPVVDFTSLAGQGDERMFKFFEATDLSDEFKGWLKNAIYMIRQELLKEQDRKELADRKLIIRRDLSNGEYNNDE